MANSKSAQSENYEHAELLFGLVAPIGTDDRMVAENLTAQLRDFGYESHMVRLSDHIAPLCKSLAIKCELDDSDELRRIKSRIKAANDLHAKTERNDLLALSAIREVRLHREQKKSGEALIRTAHIFATLKRPEEIKALRQVYGSGLYVVGIFATEEKRIDHLLSKKHILKSDAESLLREDEDDKETGGQRTRDAFHQSDVFIDIGKKEEEWKSQLGRFLDLIFSHPYHTPSKAEQAMFMANAASLRSAQFGRQVGAAILSSHGELIGLGCNEVPRPGGGQYWESDDDDARDHKKGVDSNDVRKNQILKEIVELLPKRLRGNTQLADSLRKTSLFSITEFGRASHAEMEALLSCTRTGISTLDAELFTTTFPCHNCARHIVGAGIKKVTYIEPYPKSQATILHDDSIRLTDDCGNHVPFVPFVGISPKRYAEIFSIRPVYGVEIDRKLKTGHVIPWKRSLTRLRNQMHPISYIERETYKTDELRQVVDDKKIKPLKLKRISTSKSAKVSKRTRGAK
jgi:deoxycytidylate deaminase